MSLTCWKREEITGEQPLPLLMHVGKRPATMLIVKKLAGVSPVVNPPKSEQGRTFSEPAETSPDIQNRGTSGPKIRHVYVFPTEGLW